MEVLDLTVPEVAVQSLDRDVRLEWPQEGMCCHVSACASRELFKTLRAYMKHWRKAHVQFATLYQCSNCGKKFPQLFPLKLHLVRTHHVRKNMVDSLIATSGKEVVPNKNYVNPGPTLPPRLPTKEQKIKAQERRRKEAQPTTTELDSLLQCMDDLEDYNLDL